MSRYTAARFAAVSAASAISAAAQASVKMEQRTPQSKSSKQQDDDDEEYVLGGESATSHKRKRVAAAAEPSRTNSLSSSTAASASSSVVRSSTLHRSAQVLSFPLLSDDEPNLHSVLTQVPSSVLPSSPSSSSSPSECVAQTSSSSTILSASFLPSSKFLFSLTDETRDRGSAKLAVVHVQLRQPGAAASSALNYTTSFKIDGRKSFSNAPFKKYYSRAIHAAWFAQPTANTTATTPLPNAQELTRFEPGRVLLCLSQRNGRPNGKGFTGVKHDPTSFSSKHPLLCLSSNSVEYYLSVFVNQTAETLAGESESSAPPCWAECEVDVSARFDAGAVLLEPVSLPSSAAGVAALPRPRVAPAVVAAPPAAAASSYASSSSSACSAASPSPTTLSRCSSTSSSSSTSYDRSVQESSASQDSPLTEENSSCTPLHDAQFMAEAAHASSDLEVSDASQFQLVHDDELEHAQQQHQFHQHQAWPLHHHQHELHVPAPSSMLRHSSGVCFPFEQVMQQQHQQQPQSSPFTSHFDELSSSSSAALLLDLDVPQSKRARLAVQTDSMSSHLPTLADMSWATSVSPLPMHFPHQAYPPMQLQQHLPAHSPLPSLHDQHHLAY